MKMKLCAAGITKIDCDMFGRKDIACQAKIGSVSMQSILCWLLCILSFELRVCVCIYEEMRHL